MSFDQPAPGFRSGFVTLLGRPNVGKSTLLNQLIGTKVTITSDKAQTTRHQIRGVMTRSDSQIVFVDTPGIGKPRTALGRRLNETATAAKSDVDLVCFVIDARQGYGRGDAYLAKGLDPENTVMVLNKCDGMDSARVADQLVKASGVDARAYFPISAFTGRGVTELGDYLCEQMPEGPMWYPSEQLSDTEDPQWVAELVREQLLRITREEVPHSIATRVTEYAPPHIRVEILVERDSQKGIVIGKGGTVLKEVGIKARRQLPEGTYLELSVKVDPNWQSDPDAIGRLGY